MISILFTSFYLWYFGIYIRNFRAICVTACVYSQSLR